MAGAVESWWNSLTTDRLYLSIEAQGIRCPSGGVADGELWEEGGRVAGRVRCAGAVHAQGRILPASVAPRARGDRESVRLL